MPEQKQNQLLKKPGNKYFVLGDDSGLSIESLDYAPGAFSRRWAGNETDDHFRDEKIIELLSGEENRKAYLISRFSLVDCDGKEIYKTAVKNEFRIAMGIRGNHGFGYDSVLLPLRSSIERAVEEGRLSRERADEIEKHHLVIGELSQEEKNAINNRGQIAEKIYNALVNQGIL